MFTIVLYYEIKFALSLKLHIESETRDIVQETNY